jgi:hypothetical protein
VAIYDTNPSGDSVDDDVTLPAGGVASLGIEDSAVSTVYTVPSSASTAVEIVTNEDNQSINGIKLFNDGLYTTDTPGTDAIGILGPASATAYNMTLPAAQGAVNEVLINDGTGVLSWGAPSASSALTTETLTYTSNGENQAISNSVAATLLDTSAVPGSVGFDWLARLDSEQQPTNGSENPYQVAIDSNDNAFVVMQYTDAFTIRNEDGTAGVSFDGTGAGSKVAIAKYNSSGVVQWATKIKGDNIKSSTVAVDSSDDVIIGGGYGPNSDAVFEDSGGGVTLSNLPIPGSTYEYGFLVKYDGSTGVGVWRASIESDTTSVSSRVRDIAINLTDEILACGDYSPSGTIACRFKDAGDSNILTLLNAFASNGYITKYDTAGTPLWAAKTEGSGNGSVTSLQCITVDSANNVIVGGLLTASSVNVIDSDGTQRVPNHAHAFAPQTALWVKFDTDGFCQWVVQLVNNDNPIEQTAVCADGEANLFLRAYKSLSGINYFLGTTGSASWPSSLYEILEAPNQQSTQATSLIIKINGLGIKIWDANTEEGELAFPPTQFPKKIAFCESTNRLMLPVVAQTFVGVDTNYSIAYSSGLLASRRIASPNGAGVPPFGIGNSGGDSIAILVFVDGDGVYKDQVRIVSTVPEDSIIYGMACNAAGKYWCGGTWKSDSTGDLIVLDSSGNIAYTHPLAHPTAGNLEGFLATFTNTGSNTNAILNNGTVPAVKMIAHEAGLSQTTVVSTSTTLIDQFGGTVNNTVLTLGTSISLLWTGSQWVYLSNNGGVVS